MKYKYPKISNTLSYKRIDNCTVEVTEHLTDENFIFDIETMRFAKRLDGYTNPYKITCNLSKEDIDCFLSHLYEFELIRESDIIKDSDGTILKSLWIPRVSAVLKVFALFFNNLLLLLWLPTLVVGIALFFYRIDCIKFDWMIIGYALGLVCGMVMHEFAHAFAAISYGARVFEMGVMLMHYIIPGAYVLLDSSPVKKRLQRIQINAAGVEINFWLVGAFLILGAFFPSFGGMFLNAAICNLCLGAFNLTFIKGLDGTSIVSELMGSDDIIEQSQKVVFDKTTRRKLLRQGSGGYATVITCYMLFSLQFILPLLFITNVLEAIACFV